MIKRIQKTIFIFLADYVQIHQPSLNIMPDETVRLSCEIHYGTKVARKIPSIFWFEDIYNVKIFLFNFIISSFHFL
jgi:hypothetical protein